MDKICPFCSKKLEKKENFNYFECYSCDSEYTEFSIDYSYNDMNHLIYKTSDYLVTCIVSKDKSCTKITNLNREKTIFISNSQLNIKNLTLDQVNNKIKKLALYK